MIALKARIGRSFFFTPLRPAGFEGQVFTVMRDAVIGKVRKGE